MIIPKSEDKLLISDLVGSTEGLDSKKDHQLVESLIFNSKEILDLIDHDDLFEFDRKLIKKLIKKDKDLKFDFSFYVLMKNKKYFSSIYKNLSNKSKFYFDLLYLELDQILKKYDQEFLKNFFDSELNLFLKYHLHNRSFSFDSWFLFFVESNFKNSFISSIYYDYSISSERFKKTKLKRIRKILDLINRLNIDPSKKDIISYYSYLYVFQDERKAEEILDKFFKRVLKKEKIELFEFSFSLLKPEIDSDFIKFLKKYSLKINADPTKNTLHIKMNPAKVNINYTDTIETYLHYINIYKLVKEFEDLKITPNLAKLIYCQVNLKDILNLKNEGKEAFILIDDFSLEEKEKIFLSLSEKEKEEFFSRSYYEVPEFQRLVSKKKSIFYQYLINDLSDQAFSSFFENYAVCFKRPILLRILKDREIKISDLFSLTSITENNVLKAEDLEKIIKTNKKNLYISALLLNKKEIKNINLEKLNSLLKRKELENLIKFLLFKNQNETIKLLNNNKNFLLEKNIIIDFNDLLKDYIDFNKLISDMNIELIKNLNFNLIDPELKPNSFLKLLKTFKKFNLKEITDSHLFIYLQNYNFSSQEKLEFLKRAFLINERKISDLYLEYLFEDRKYIIEYEKFVKDTLIKTNFFKSKKRAKKLL